MEITVHEENFVIVYFSNGTANCQGPFRRLAVPCPQNAVRPGRGQNPQPACPLPDAALFPLHPEVRLVAQGVFEGLAGGVQGGRHVRGQRRLGRRGVGP